MGRYQYTAENDDYEADLERIRISRKRKKARKRRVKRMAQLGRLSVRMVILVIAGWICLNLLRSNAVTAHADGNESETTSLIAKSIPPNIHLLCWLHWQIIRRCWILYPAIWNRRPSLPMRH